ncbi:MAG: UDP-N-acetylmuramyl-tripeptide synthetase [Patescibacteria group bacterium]
MISWYHQVLAILAMIVYGNPSAKMIVIGVTGTNGKSTTVNLIGKILETADNKVGWTTTANFKVADQEWFNDQKMTMLGRLKTQKLLSDMVKKGCKYAIIETSSEGIKQFRHIGINYDIALFTNLTPEHLEAHGGFENYKKAKGQLFKHLTNRPHKIINEHKIDKTIVANVDDEQADYFLNFKADKKITYSINKVSDFHATDIILKPDSSVFSLLSSVININLIGQVNIYNALAAIAVAKSQGISDQIIKKALVEFKIMPGRFEWINEGQQFKVMVDYAPEPESMKKLQETLAMFKFNKIIHVLGSCGGGRDKARQPIMGTLAARKADYVIITNEDPYDDDPMMIINNVAQGALDEGKILNQNLFKILDRREAIKKALSLAQADDLVLITGKANEQYICVARGQKIPWDDRMVVRALLKK